MIQIHQKHIFFGFFFYFFKKLKNRFKNQAATFPTALETHPTPK
jgi:hypothetical protein